MKTLPPDVKLSPPGHDLKAANKARYQRRYARHKAVVPSGNHTVHTPTRLHLAPLERAQSAIRGVPEYLQMVVNMRFGKKGTWGHGRQPSGTTSGPGIRPLPRLYRTSEGSPLLERDHPPGTKLIRRFIRTSGKESTFWRNAYAVLTGRQYG
jgi:hypothetical protein